MEFNCEELQMAHNTEWLGEKHSRWDADKYKLLHMDKTILNHA